MNERAIKISKIEDVILLKNKAESFYNQITLCATSLMKLGVFRHALKYSVWSLDVGGIINIDCPVHKTYAFSNKRIDFWQVSREVFKSIGDDVSCLEHSLQNGFISLKKKEERYQNSGVSFCVVFSGNHDELPMLIKALNSIRSSVKSSGANNYEIIVSGPSSHNPHDWLLSFNDVNISYSNFDFVDVKRLMIGQKKNFLLSIAKYNAVVISHTRIEFSDDFFQSIMDRKFDLCTTAIFGRYKKGLGKYLDIGLIGSYDLTKRNSSRTLVASSLVDNYMFHLSKRVAYIDGGLTIFNKNVLSKISYNSNVSWGEAEDVQVSETVSTSGGLVDIYEDIVSLSSVVKFEKKGCLHNLFYRAYSFMDKHF